MLAREHLQRQAEENAAAANANVRLGSFPDIHERLLTAKSGSSWIRRQRSDDVPLNDRYRLLAALQLFEKLSPRSAAIGQ